MHVLISEVLVANPNLEQVFRYNNPLGNHGTALLLESMKPAKAHEYLSMDHVNADDGVVLSLLETMQERESI